MNPLLSEIVRALAAPVTALLDPTKRVFAPFLVGALAIAILARGLRGGASLRGVTELLGGSAWRHPSARADLALIIARALLKLLSLGAWSVSSLAVAALSLSWLRLHVGSPALRASSLVVGALFTLSAFVIEDLTRFAVHRAMHRVPWLWAFHRVHHSAEVLTPFTLYRTHPVEGAINQAASALAVGLVMGALAWCFGPALRGWQLLGVDAVGFVWALAGANLRHSHVWLSYGPRVEALLLSPAQHQVHHSRDPRHADKNFGTALALWDRLAGSLYTTTATPEPLRFGLPPGEREVRHTVPSMLLTPFASIADRLRRPGLALLGAALMLTSCTEERVDRVAPLVGMARCTMQLHTDFQSAAGALAAAAAAWSATPNDATRATARSAWQGAVDVWQRAEMHRYGPAGGFDVVGGQGIREHVYAWPDLNRCLVEQRIVSRGYEGAGFAQLPTSAKGLAAMEYLLFFEGTENACAPTESINAMGTWAALGADELNRRRAAYARAIADDLVTRATALRTAWTTGGFETQLVTAGRGSTMFRTQQEAFNAIANAVFHLDTDVKDLRLARPLGIMGCAAASCPESLESTWARRGLDHIRNNMVGARMLLEGCAAGDMQGFDDRLDGAGAGALSARMRTLLAGVDAAINAIPGGDLHTALSSDPASVRRLHDAVRALTDFLKMEFTVTLQITGSRVEGDND